ncbi:PadR family transcriptional regulator [Cupriavidus necator]|uniref:PadR family transcriptional regulator n=1 Tax=Cupriavidus necator TaxID=106590 RepID=UPI00339DA750
MSTQHALLISLIEKPSSGYDLARRFDRSIGYFWHATHQQIYRELGRMADSGWIVADETEVAEGEGAAADRKNRKKVYRVLPAGRDELVRWVLSPGAGLDQREEILVKLRADAVIGPLGLGDEMRRLIALHQARLETYLAIERRDFSAPDMDRAQQLRYALLRRGIRFEQDWVSWGEELLPLLEKHARQAAAAK